ncbi:STAS domain-containing protein [uncultured Vibrio sp.]|uniref:STAS domain-containing protein n=1 Tax=uncultured Vibrio sp. TaxID=114054 RepID=UPI00091BABF9|nr:STAS domain-containing protein [uncultured Vibrio sp.]OIQ26301.1 MAG: anti-anti-sigma factor [Vibrio sp. MedPE-SWchi]
MELRTVEATDTILTVEIIGNLDAEGSRDAQPQIDAVITDEKHNEIELDFSRVDFLDSSGVGALVYLYKRLVERERNMRIENVRGQPLEIIKLLRIGQAIPVNSNTH